MAASVPPADGDTVSAVAEAPPASVMTVGPEGGVSPRSRISLSGAGVTGWPDCSGKVRVAEAAGTTRPAAGGAVEGRGSPARDPAGAASKGSRCGVEMAAAPSGGVWPEGTVWGVGPGRSGAAAGTSLSQAAAATPQTTPAAATLKATDRRCALKAVRPAPGRRTCRRRAGRKRLSRNRPEPSPAARSATAGSNRP